MSNLQQQLDILHDVSIVVGNALRTLQLLCLLTISGMTVTWISN